MTTEIDLNTLLEVPIGETLEDSRVKQILASAPFLPIPQALNLRTISAPSLQPNLVFRSGSLSHLPQSSLIQLSENYNITTIFDLRNRKEREKYPSPEIPGIETIWIPSSADIPVPVGVEAAQGNPKQVLQGISPANFAENNGVDGYLKMYGNVLDTHKPIFEAVFEKLKEPQGGLLFHCTGSSSFVPPKILLLCLIGFELES
jgi:protein tyrosine/serine phosphatase